MMSVGLVLGKFAPLHKGHQLLIDTATSENERVIVLIYDAPETSVPLTVRSAWIRKLYPQVEVIEAWDGPNEVGDTPEIKAMHERYLLDVLKDIQIANFYSSEFYGEHVSQALGAKDRRLDPLRLKIPISGSEIRNDAYACRQFLDAVVYRDLITKVVFLGAPSTGKTTLACEMAKERDTVWLPEYGREYWENHNKNRKLTTEQLVEIAEGHREREDAKIVEANREIFIDTDATTTYMFSQYYHGMAQPRLSALAQNALQRYDLFFLCETDIPYEDTWDRSGDANRHVFQKKIKADLLQRKVPFITLSGSLPERMQIVSNVLDRFNRFTSIGNHLRSSSKE